MKNLIWKRIFKFSVIICILLSVAGCADIRNLRVVGWHPTSISPKGLSALDASFRLDISNPGQDMDLSEISAMIRQSGRDIASITADTVRIAGGGTHPSDVRCTVRILDGLSLFDIKNLLGSSDFSTYYVDISARVGSGNGKGHMMKVNGIPLTQLIKL